MPKISEMTTYTEPSFPEGAFVPVIIPDGSGGFLNRKIDLSNLSLALYIDLEADGTDTLTDSRLENRDVIEVTFGGVSINGENYSKSLEATSITSSYFADLSEGTKIRIYFGATV